MLKKISILLAKPKFWRQLIVGMATAILAIFFLVSAYEAIYHTIAFRQREWAAGVILLFAIAAYSLSHGHKGRRWIVVIVAIALMATAYKMPEPPVPFQSRSTVAAASATGMVRTKSTASQAAAATLAPCPQFSGNAGAMDHWTDDVDSIDIMGDNIPSGCAGPVVRLPESWGAWCWWPLLPQNTKDQADQTWALRLRPVALVQGRWTPEVNRDGTWFTASEIDATTIGPLTWDWEANSPGSGDVYWEGPHSYRLEGTHLPGGGIRLTRKEPGAACSE